MAARCPNAKLVHKNLLFHGKKIIFQLLSCLYLYDSEMLGPICIRKQRLYTVRRRGSTIHRIAGIPSAGACGNEPFGRYTVVRRRREVCVKSVYRLPASKGLICRQPTTVNSLDARSRSTDFAQTSLRCQKSVDRRHGISTPRAGSLLTDSVF